MLLYSNIISSVVCTFRLNLLNLSKILFNSLAKTTYDLRACIVLLYSGSKLQYVSNNWIKVSKLQYVSSETCIQVLRS